MVETVVSTEVTREVQTAAEPADNAARSRFAIGRFTGDFTDPTTERAFCEQRFPAWRRTGRFAILLGGLLGGAMAAGDVFGEAGQPILPWVLGLRALQVIAAGIGFWALRRATPRSLQRHFLAQGFFLFGWMLALRQVFGNPEPWGLLGYMVLIVTFGLGLTVTTRSAALFSGVALATYNLWSWLDPISGGDASTRAQVILLTFMTSALTTGFVNQKSRAARTQYAGEIMERESAALLSRQRSEAEAARIAAETAARSEAEFLATMSHEIRTPLNGMIGMLQLLDGTALNALQRDHVETLHASADTLLSIVNDILEFSRAEAGEIPLDHGAFDSVDMLRQVVALFASQVQNKRLVIKTQLRDLPAQLMGDARRLRQILLNLIGNAVKFTEQGSVTVSLSRKPGGDWYRFAVTDTGIGISAEAQTRLFRKFSQADSSVTRRFGGTGLGLAISKRFVEAMGGRIGVESASGSGSCFWFEVELPAVQRPAPAPASVASPEAGVPPQRILLVEDVALNQKIAVGLLQTRGHDVTVANDGQEALTRLAGETFDLVFMDLHMPRMDGLAATRQLRAGGVRQPAIPVIGLTASVLDVDRARCLDAGMDDVITKPFSLASLDRAIRGVVARKAPARVG